MWRGGLGRFVKVHLDNSTSCVINLVLKRYQRFLQELYSVFDILQVCSLVGCTVFIITTVVFLSSEKENYYYSSLCTFFLSPFICIC